MIVFGVHREHSFFNISDIKVTKVYFAFSEVNSSVNKVIKYRLYSTKEDKRELLFELKGNDYTLKNPENFNTLELAAVDDLGIESETAGLNLFKNKYTIGIYPGVIMPLGKFGEMAGTGYGGMFSFGTRYLFSGGFDAGLGAGFYHAQGKDLSGENKSKYNSFMIIPVLLNTGYRINTNSNFSISPSVSFGMSYIAISYKNMNSLTSVIVERSKKTFDPTVMAGIGMEYTVSVSFAVSVNGSYGMLIEKDGPMQFASMSVGFKYMF